MCNAHNWQVGQTVQAGFMTVKVRAKLFDSICIVSNLTGDKLYKFIPHRGVHSITNEQAKALLAQDAAIRNRASENIAACESAIAANDALFA